MLEDLFIRTDELVIRKVNIKKQFFWNTDAKIGTPLPIKKYANRFEIKSGDAYKAYPGVFKLVFYIKRKIYGVKIYRGMLVPNLDDVSVSHAHAELFYDNIKLELPSDELIKMCEVLIGDNYES